MASRQLTLPMEAAGTEHFIERAYRESGTYQWVRETLINAFEADATRVEFGIEWQAVENLGVYRRTVADNGIGMTPDELEAFFNTFGGGGKPIGGVHENFGIGAKTSLLPWNRYGLVVISWVDGEPSMIWLHRDPETEKYGLRLMETVDADTGEPGLDGVFGPFNDEKHGCDWSAIKPSWIDDHGTVLVMLGNDPDYDSVLGDPSRSESDIKGVSTYLNRRLWQIPDGAEVFVDELRTQDRSKWPNSRSVAHGSQPKEGPDRRTNTRKIEGAKYYIEYPIDSFDKGELANSGTVPLDDGTEVDWYLWEGERPAVQSYAAIGGYIGALYENELYDVTTHHSTYRTFGVSESEVRKNLWLILRPPLAGEGHGFGVYPRGDRNSLLVRGGPRAGEQLPISDWAGEFADKMPKAIRDAIRRARGGDEGSLGDKWRERLAERFGTRWRIAKLRASRKGKESVDPTQLGSRPKKVKRRSRRGRRDGGSEGGRGGSTNTGSGGAEKPASKKKVVGGIPSFRAVGSEEIGGEGVLAAWQPNDPDHPEGVVLLNVEHAVLEAEIEHLQAQYADHHAEDVRREVIKAYGEVAVAKVAHSEHLKGILPTETVEKELRSETSLTMSLLGLIAEEALIKPRIGGKFAKRHSA